MVHPAPAKLVHGPAAEFAVLIFVIHSDPKGGNLVLSAIIGAGRIGCDTLSDLPDVGSIRRHEVPQNVYRGISNIGFTQYVHRRARVCTNGSVPHNRR